jgi:(5-formylfuran-3-yl)methyl phosphate synthase
MTRLLASIRTVEEAALVLGNGADIIDCKDPGRGALGALPVATVAEVVCLVAQKKPVSATIGDLPMRPRLLRLAVESMARTGVTFVKVGFFPDARANLCIDELAMVTSKVSVVAVLFADRNPQLDMVERLARGGFAGVMLDTADKSAGGLRSHMSIETLAAFVQLARGHGLFTGLAGSLKIEDVAALLPLAPDYLGFRGALCADATRTGNLSAPRCAAIRAAIDGGVSALWHNSAARTVTSSGESGTFAAR